jgi:outer membrane protein assembly factor BamB
MDGNLLALELASGKEVWRFRGGSGFVASPAVGEGVMVLANEDGQVFCLDLIASP